MLHPGHIQLFRRARRLGDRLIVGVQQSREAMRSKRDCKLVYSTEERLFMVKALKYVDEVLPYAQVDEIVQRVEFDILAVGPDQTHAAFQRAFDWCAAHGKRIEVLPRTEGISTSWLKQQIKNM